MSRSSDGANGGDRRRVDEPFGPAPSARPPAVTAHPSPVRVPAPSTPRAIELPLDPRPPPAASHALPPLPSPPPPPPPQASLAPAPAPAAEVATHVERRHETSRPRGRLALVAGVLLAAGV